ncbi:hypothetical protein K661_03241 [Piscirickettsia salmonis LF-89 = ATCC VR-1361]|nr:hypothetical protein K661_03241 [Piscirickettsia salmonis LF-89 = ATCC VR-1361]
MSDDLSLSDHIWSFTANLNILSCSQDASINLSKISGKHSNIESGCPA